MKTNFHCLWFDLTRNSRRFVPTRSLLDKLFSIFHTILDAMLCFRKCVIPQSLLKDKMADCVDNSDLCFFDDGQLNSHKCFRCLNGDQIVALHQVRSRLKNLCKRRSNFLLKLKFLCCIHLDCSLDDYSYLFSDTITFYLEQIM